MNKKVNKPYLLRLMPVALISAVMGMGIVSCNSKEEEPKDDANKITYLPNVAVTAFRLKADKDVMANLDSVFFSIDLEHGVIYNADSLPLGTKIDKLVANITYSSAVTSASVIMTGGKTRNDSIDYIKHPGDSIDFTGNVRLRLSTANNEMSKTYTVKVNVHKQEPDSLMWNEMALAALPSRLGSPRNQKTVDFNGKAVALIEENDGSTTISSSDDLYSNVWTKTQVSLPFTPDVRSFTASSEALYLLDTTGKLYTSADAISWTSTGEVWSKIIGGYKNSAIGLKTTAQGLFYSQYPLIELQERAVDADFPIDGASNFALHSNKWTSSPVGFFCGGLKADGSLSDAIWAFDGSVWVKLSEGEFPALKGASLIPYYAFRRTTGALKPSELDVWMILGGETSDGSFNRTLYISYNNGVNWRKGDELIQLPTIIPPMTACDNLVMTTTKESELSDAWKIMVKSQGPARVKWNVDGDLLIWECPYIYLIGGFSPDGSLYDTIWRGAINRLQSPPII